MLKRFSVKDFKNFDREITIDFSKVSGYEFNTDCLNKELLSKILIYGRNATGKTNLGRAILDISTFRRINNPTPDNSESFVNIFSNGEAFFSYTFIFNGKEIRYEYSKDNNQVIQSEAFYLNEKRLWLKKIESDGNNSIKYISDESVTVELGILNDDFDILTDNYFKDLLDSDELFERQNYSFLRWLISNTRKTEGSVLVALDNFIKNLRGISTTTIDSLFVPSLKTISEADVAECSNFVSKMGIPYTLKLVEQVDGEKELYFDINGELLNFKRNSSSGTKNLVNFYFRVLHHFLSGKHMLSVLFLDEFDAFYHYELTENLVKYLKEKFPETQIIFTTHDTNLFSNELFRPDVLMILSRDGRLTPINKATKRELREGHNLEKMYISGEFEDYE